MSILAKIKTILPQSKFPAVGVDISDSSIEFIQLKIGAKKPQIKTLYRQVIQAGLVENGKIV